MFYVEMHVKKSILFERKFRKWEAGADTFSNREREIRFTPF